MPKPQSPEDQENAFAIRLLEIDVALTELSNERSMILNNIARIRKLQQNFKGPRRKDSIKKALVEACIIEVLSESTKKMRASDLIAELEKRTGKINRSTASSHFKRMEDRGSIKTAGHGYWVIGGSKPLAKKA